MSSRFATLPARAPPRGRTAAPSLRAQTAPAQARAASRPMSTGAPGVRPDPACPCGGGCPSCRTPVVPEPGGPVPGAMRDRFRRVTGQSVDGVRVHTGGESQAAAVALGARAFTLGRDIHFATGEFQPGTSDGDHLLAHELTHTVQQSAVAPVPQRRLQAGDPEDPAEGEADDIADAVLDDSDRSLPLDIAALPPAGAEVQLAPKKKKKKGTGGGKAKPKPKPIPFTLFGTKFTTSVDPAGNVTVKPAGKAARGWTFTEAGANQTTAERKPAQAEYVHAGGTAEKLVERCTITVPPGGPAKVSPIIAELDSPPKLAIELSGQKSAAKRKSITVNNATVEQLDLPASAITFTPADGDAIHLDLGGDAWVFSSLKPDPVAPATTAPAVQGFFRVGYFTRYLDHGVPTPGIATPGVSDAARKRALSVLTGSPTPAARQITADEADMFATVSLIESDFAGVQTYDSGILSFGFSQWTVNSDLPRMLARIDATTFDLYLGRYGLEVAAPVRQLDSFVRQFVGTRRNRLGVRNPSEMALFLNRKELVNKRLLAKAASQATVLDGFAKQAVAARNAIDAAKPDLKSKDKTRRAAAMKAMKSAHAQVAALLAAMRGLAGVSTLKDVRAQADQLANTATTGAAAARDLTAHCADSEVMRGEEWALRFEMLGQSPGGQDAEIKEVRANWTDVDSKSTHGASFHTLLPNVRGKAALLSSYLNTHGAVAGVGRAVDQFKAGKIAEATAAAAAAAAAKKPAPSPTVADWRAFPWPAGDARWTSLWTAKAIKEFETIAIIEMTKPTTNPARRRQIIKAQFP